MRAIALLSASAKQGIVQELIESVPGPVLIVIYQSVGETVPHILDRQYN